MVRQYNGIRDVPGVQINSSTYKEVKTTTGRNDCRSKNNKELTGMRPACSTCSAASRFFH